MFKELKRISVDANEIKRSLASIESELKRRQALFNKAREISGESTVDIYKYQKMFRQGILTDPVSHLFIICDESIVTSFSFLIILALR